MGVVNFISEHKALCVASCGLAILSYLGCLTVEWILQKTGLIKKIDEVAQAALKTPSNTLNKPLLPSEASLAKHIQKPVAKPKPAIQKDKPAPSKKAPQEIISSEQSKTLSEEYGVHGIINGSNYCYAISAYQLLSNIDSLRTSIMNKLPKKFTDYSSIETGQQLLTLINKNKKKHKDKVLFEHGVQFDSSDILFHFLNQVADFSTPITSRTTQQSDPLDPTTQYSTDREELTHSIDLVLPPRKFHIVNFQESLKASLAVHEKPAVIIPDDTVLFKGIQFRQPPKHLVVRIGRRDDITKPKDNRLLDNPQILDLNACNGMVDGVAANPLYLKGFIIHLGDATAGHYIAYFRKNHPTKPNEFQWFKADDSTVTAISEEKALNLAKKASDLYYDENE